MRPVEAANGERWDRSRHVDSERNLALWLGRQWCGLKLTEFGGLAGDLDYRTVRWVVVQVSQRIDSGPKFAKLANRMWLQIQKPEICPCATFYGRFAVSFAELVSDRAERGVSADAESVRSPSTNMSLRVYVDFNSRDEYDHIFLNPHGPSNAMKLLWDTLVEGAKVTLWDEEIEVEAHLAWSSTLEMWLGIPDWSTKRDA